MTIKYWAIGNVQEVVAAVAIISRITRVIVIINTTSLLKGKGPKTSYCLTIMWSPIGTSTLH